MYAVVCQFGWLVGSVLYFVFAEGLSMREGGLVKDLAEQNIFHFWTA